MDEKPEKEFTESPHESKPSNITLDEIQAEYDRISVSVSYKDRLFGLLKSFGDRDCTLSSIELHNQLGIAQRTIRQHLAELETEGKISRSYPKPNKRIIKVLKGR